MLPICLVVSTASGMLMRSATLACCALQVGIVTLQTAREVAAETGVPESDIDINDEAVGAVVVTGSQLT